MTPYSALRSHPSSPTTSRMPSPRLVFMGTADLAATVLALLVESFPGQLLGAISQPDRPKGRDLTLQPTPVKAEALRRGLPVWQPEKARSPEFQVQLRALNPDVLIVAAYGQLLPQSLLDIPRHGCINVHTSLLPRWRGAAPIQWAIASGDAITGVTLMRMDAGLDTGPMLATQTTEIRDDDTGQTLHDRLAKLGAELLVESLPAYLAGQLPARPQPTEGSTYARKITREDGRLVWSQPAEVLWRRLRAFTPWPGAFALLPGETKLKLLKIHAATPSTGEGKPGLVLSADKSGLVIACGRGALRITEVQPEGGKRLNIAQFLAGHRVSQLE